MFNCERCWDNPCTCKAEPDSAGSRMAQRDAEFSVNTASGSAAQPQPPTDPAWRETVRAIYDLAQGGHIFSGAKLAALVLEKIEKRHHTYFCTGTTGLKALADGVAGSEGVDRVERAEAEVARLREAINRALEQLEHPGDWMSHVREPLRAALAATP